MNDHQVRLFASIDQDTAEIQDLLLDMGRSHGIVKVRDAVDHLIKILPEDRESFGAFLCLCGIAQMQRVLCKMVEEEVNDDHTAD